MKTEVLVVGSGHAGCEAALAAARMGAKTLLLSLYLDNLALMPCNPSIGGPAKGHLVREIDALGGEQALAADTSTLHLRWLNTSKGAAVRTLRAQCDLAAYHAYYNLIVQTTPNLDLHQALVTDLWIESGRVRGVRTNLGLVIEAEAVILATGTYLGGKVHIGLNHFPSGPLGQVPALELTRSLVKAGFEVGRLKTGTTPRLHADSIDWKSLVLQESDPEPEAFSYFSPKKRYEGFFCGLTRSTKETHDLIRANLDRSPLFTGVIEGVGPRYCPSIEDKVVRFPDRESHPVFLEPVSRSSREIYMQNFSTSLPYDVQEKIVHSLPGCEKAHILRPGYAIEYDFLVPTQLEPWLETKRVKGLFCAGQINGTSGYEEAAAQGLLAGINAVLRLRGEDPLVLGRDQAYMGVLVDDLVTRGTREPYRMFTSRCEHRLLLRHDNADMRLAPIGRKLGLLDDAKWKKLTSRWELMERERKRLAAVKVLPTPETNALLASKGGSPLDAPVSALDLLRRPEVDAKMIAVLIPSPDPIDPELLERISVEVKYEGYIERQERQVERLHRLESLRFPPDFDFSTVKGLLSESRQKLQAIRPRTLGQASRIPGVTPADIQLLWVAISNLHRLSKGDEV